MKKMINKKIICVVLMCAISLPITVHAAAPSYTEVTAESAVLIDADTGQILYSKNMDAKRSPASITKVMTGLLTMENCEPDEIATVSETAVQIPWNTSHVALTSGEKLPVGDLMYALMLPSANDAANVLAEHVAGSQEDFARMMTARAKELGANNTSFANPHGLDDPQHYTTALDMALITRDAISNPEFLKYFGTARHTIPATNLQSEERPFTNQQYMILPDQWVYNPDIIGGKVGFTEEARHTMSTAAAKDGRTLICVVMGCGIDEKFYDTQTLLDYGFDSFVQVPVPMEKVSGLSVPVMESGDYAGEAVFSVDSELSVLLPSTLSADDIKYRYDMPESIEKGDTPDAAVTLTAPGIRVTGLPEVLLTVPLTASFRYDESAVAVSNTVTDKNTGLVSALKSMLRIGWIPAATVAVAVVAVAIRRIQINRRRARRRQRMQRVDRMRKYGNIR